MIILYSYVQICFLGHAKHAVYSTWPMLYIGHGPCRFPFKMVTFLFLLSIFFFIILSQKDTHVTFVFKGRMRCIG